MLTQTVPFYRHVLQALSVLIGINHQNLVKRVTIAMEQDIVSPVQKVFSVRIVHQNPLLALKDSTVLEGMQHVQFALRGTSVLMAHH